MRDRDDDYPKQWSGSFSQSNKGKYLLKLLPAIEWRFDDAEFGLAREAARLGNAVIAEARKRILSFLVLHEWDSSRRYGQRRNMSDGIRRSGPPALLCYIPTSGIFHSECKTVGMSRHSWKIAPKLKL